MKIITINQLKFAVGFAVLTILFRYGLSNILNIEYFVYVWLLAILYFTTLFIVGWVFGKKDYLSFPFYDVGFRFHLSSYILYITISELWFLFEMQSRYENIKTVHLTALIWGIFLVIHFFFFLYTRKNAIKGINKSDIFE